MALTDQYLDRFRHEQQDAFNPAARTSFDEFGHIRDTPTVEGFDGWGKPTHDRAAALARVRIEEASKVRMTAHNDEARRRCNRLMHLRGLVK